MDSAHLTLSIPPRRFAVDRLPDFSWLLQHRVTLTSWELDSGWRVQVTEARGGLLAATSLRLLGPSPEEIDYEATLTPVPALPGAEPTDALAALVGDHPAARLRKTRRGCMLDGVWWFVDEYHDRHQGLMIAATTALGAGESTGPGRGVAARPRTAEDRTAVDDAATEDPSTAEDLTTAGGAARPVIPVTDPPGWVGREVTADDAYAEHRLAHRPD